jgi:hypothetical protein
MTPQEVNKHMKHRCWHRTNTRGSSARGYPETEGQRGGPRPQGEAGSPAPLGLCKWVLWGHQGTGSVAGVEDAFAGVSPVTGTHWRGVVLLHPYLRDEHGAFSQEMTRSQVCLQ